jgi:hypothetical protein
VAAAARVGDVGKEVGKTTHMLGGQHDFWGSVLILGVEDGRRQACLGLGVQGADEDALGRTGRHAVARARTAKTAGVSHVVPIGGAVDRAVEVSRIDEGLQQQRRVAEARLFLPSNRLEDNLS